MLASPELAAQVRLMPVQDLGVDAAILFNDILAVPTAMGMELTWTDHGPRFERPLALCDNPLRELHAYPEKLEPVYQTIDRVVSAAEAPLIGFCGAPLTTLCYMLQGDSSKVSFPLAKRFFFERPDDTRQLVDAVTEFTLHYVNQQLAHGIQAFQLFESHAGLVPAPMYAELFLPAVRKIAAAVRAKGIPFIFFPKGLGCGLQLITPDVCDFVSIDWQTPLDDARRMVHPAVGLQGNFDPHLLFASEAVIDHTLSTYVSFFQANPNWIVNLGHGVLADTPFERLSYFVNRIKDINWK